MNCRCQFDSGAGQQVSTPSSQLFYPDDRQIVGHQILNNSPTNGSGNKNERFWHSTSRFRSPVSRLIWTLRCQNTLTLVSAGWLAFTRPAPIRKTNDCPLHGCTIGYDNVNLKATQSVSASVSRMFRHMRFSTHGHAHADVHLQASPSCSAFYADYSLRCIGCGRGMEMRNLTVGVSAKANHSQSVRLWLPHLSHMTRTRRK